jgi:hypothetical protein
MLTIACAFRFLSRRALPSVHLAALVGCLWLATIALADHAHSDIRAHQSTFASIVNRYAQAMDRRLPNEVLSTIHSQSPTFAMTIRHIQQTFRLYDIEVLNQGFSDLGFDGTDHVATAIFSNRKRSGPIYQDNLTKAVVVFRQENGTWKIWAMLPIEVTPLP